jgi:hypothetical protein
MAGVIKFVFSGIDKGIQQMDALSKKITGAKSATGGKVGGGLIARVGAAGGMGQLGQIGAALGSPLGVIGGAAVVAGLALRRFAAQTNESIDALERSVATRTGARAKIADAAKSADESALSSVIARRSELIGGARGRTEIRSLFKDVDLVKKQIDSANLDRALKVGANPLRSELAAIRSPESAAMLEMGKTALDALRVQQEISAKLTPFQEFWRNMGNAFTGKERYQSEIDAARNAIDATGGP